VLFPYRVHTYFSVLSLYCWLLPKKDGSFWIARNAHSLGSNFPGDKIEDREPVSRKSRELFGCEQLVVRLQSTCFEKSKEDCEVWWLGTSALWRHKGNRPFATSDRVVQDPPCWRGSSFLFLYWDIKTKRPEPVKLDLPLFWCPIAGMVMSLLSSMAGFCTTWSLVAKGLLWHPKIFGTFEKEAPGRLRFVRTGRSDRLIRKSNAVFLPNCWERLVAKLFILEEQRQFGQNCRLPFPRNSRCSRLVETNGKRP